MSSQTFSNITTNLTISTNLTATKPIQKHKKNHLYLETGATPIRYAIIKKRISYLHHLITREKNELISKVFYAQKRKPVKDDWVITVDKNMTEINLKLTENEMNNMKKFKFKELLKNKIHTASFKYLQKIQEKHSKSKDIKYEHFQIQQYLTNNKFTTKEKIMLFQLRTSMNDVKLNFKSMYTDYTCDLCEESVPQSTTHLLDCEKILSNCPDLYNDTDLEYHHIFIEVEKQLSAVKLFCKVYQVKQNLEDETEN